VAQINAWRHEFLRYVNTQYPQIASSINSPETKYDLTDEMENLLKKALEEFNAQWQQTHAAKA
jgi:F0F1-type ATP synthase alpha subunit